MEKLLEKSIIKISRVKINFLRYLHDEIDLDQRFIAIKGARGSGKTTFLLQIAKKYGAKNVLYVALDDLYFTNHTIYDLAETFYRKGGKLLLLDEVHKYSNWSRELKLIYDDFDDLKVFFTSSSLLDIYKGESDLSRRVTSYFLKELSFREFLSFKKNIQLPSHSLEALLQNHQSIALTLLQDFKPFVHFEEYLKYGAFPYYDNDPFSYYQKLLQTIQLILEIDLPGIEHIEYHNIAKIKRLLYVLSSNVPYTPNIQKLSTQVDLNRNLLVRVLQLLDKSSLIHTLYQQSKSISTMNKPDKIWLRNTNMMYAIAQNEIDKGTLRETFMLQNLVLTHELALPAKGDILVDQKYTLEIGGKTKSKKQIDAIENAYIVKDDIEIGVSNTIPIWLFGFLY